MSILGADTTTESEVRNLTDEDQIAKYNKRAEIDQKNQDNDVTVVLRTPHGRRFVERILDHCGIFRKTYRRNSEMVLLEGMREVGLDLLSWCEDADPDILIKLMKDRADRLGKRVD